jgi:hypothetical protein
VLAVVLLWLLVVAVLAVAGGLRVRLLRWLVLALGFICLLLGVMVSLLLPRSRPRHRL